jgi:GTP-binding protein HflX
VHIIDISHPQFEDQYNTVNETLADIKSSNKPCIIVFNKTDAYTASGGFEEGINSKPGIQELMKTWMAKLNEKCIFISATEKDNFPELKKLLYNEIREIHTERFPYNDFLYQEYE